MIPISSILDIIRGSSPGATNNAACMIEGPCSAKAEMFVDALVALCKEHGVTLTTRIYDGLEVWDDADGSIPIYCAGIRDRTDASPAEAGQ
jgi:hypothetical protein